MSELDSAAVEAAAAVVRELVTNGGVDPFTNAYWIESTREIVTAYLAARPTPDAEAWVPMSDDDVAAMTARIKSGEADADEQARFAMTNMMFIIYQWASGAVDATSQQAYAAALLRHAESVNALYRKAVSR